MSKLQLSILDNKVTNAILPSYEKNQVPKPNEPVFIYDPKDELYKATNTTNLNIIRKAMGWSKIDYLNKMTGASVKNVGKNDNGSDFIDNRASEFEQMFDELSKLFLTLIHKATWNHYGAIGVGKQQAGKTKYIQSTLWYEDVYDDIKMVIESMELLQTKIINDKYNEKYSTIEVQNAMKLKNLDIQETIGRIGK